MLGAFLGRARSAVRIAAASLLASCLLATSPRAESGEVDPAPLARFIREAYGKGNEAEGWASDLLRALRELRFDRSAENVCASVAIIGQESGFVANPVVPGIGVAAAEAASKKIESSFKYTAFFMARQDVKREFLRRIRAARTERDLDHAYRWVVTQTLDIGGISDILKLLDRVSTLTEFVEGGNEVNTLGSMQVSAKFALREQSGKEISQLRLDETYKIRDSLYQRYEGMYFGIKQLLGYRADYDQKTSLFADYNAGRYSSRNAAIQWMAAELSGDRLEIDGDLLSYRDDTPIDGVGKTEAALSKILRASGSQAAESLRADLLLEKTALFNRTETFKAVRQMYKSRFGKEPPYEMVPRIVLKNIKIKRLMTTEIFANAVNRRYVQCMASLAPAGDAPRVSARRLPTKAGAGPVRRKAT